MRLLPTTASRHSACEDTTPIEERAIEAENFIMSPLKTARHRLVPMPDTYFDLVRRHPLTSIRTEVELDCAQSVLDRLLQQKLDDGSLAYLDALSDLVIVYEREHHAIAPLPPHELLANLLEERSMSQADLVRSTGIAKATFSELVSGRQDFTVAQMHAIAEVFGLPGTVFMPGPANS